MRARVVLLALSAGIGADGQVGLVAVHDHVVAKGKAPAPRRGEPLRLAKLELLRLCGRGGPLRLGELTMAKIEFTMLKKSPWEDRLCGRGEPLRLGELELLRLCGLG